ncbi:MAG TPA: penicillin acylase family protein [Thermoanaerobaculia bacterium]|nr:penicillin acylase family protein [Thermoanaerobaculia bacterium]
MRRFLPAVLSVFAAFLIFTSLPLPAYAAPPPPSGAFDETVVDGLFRPVRIRRDAHDIPHIFAANDRDALFALGYSHARDRFFQMDLLRRTFSGTLTELVGEPALAQDIQLRTLGLRRAAEASLPVLSSATRAWLTAYARGVNSYIRNPANPLPPEYGVLELSQDGIRPWDPVDSLVIGKGLAFNLSFDLGDIDLTTALFAFQTAGTLAGFEGEALFYQDLYRSAPFDPAVSIPGFLPDSDTARAKGPVCSASKSLYLSDRTAGLARSFSEKARQIPLLRDALERRETGRGSNWWVASGKVTATGRPLLANDPHLGLDTPSIFYEAQLRIAGGERPAMNAFGVTFPGIPGIVLGCNPRICWGATTNPMDVTDVYQERLVFNPATGLPAFTVFDGNQEPLVAIPQSFFVNQPGDDVLNNLVRAGVGPLEGGVTLIVPRRNNGPIVAVDVSNPAEPLALSVQYTGWSPTRELDAFRIWNRAGNLADFRQGLNYFDVGSQNWAYADVAGNIAYFTSAEMPLREDLQLMRRWDGLPPFFIRDGTHTRKNEWLPAPASPARRDPGQAIPYEILPFREMPQVVNPERGWIANANNDPVGTSLDNNPLNQLRRGGQGIYYLGPGYDGGFRMGRIERLLEAELERDGSFSKDDFKRFQANNQMLDAEILTPHLLAAFDRASATNASGLLAGLAANPRVAEAVGRLRTWDYSTPTGIREGYDPGDDPTNLPEPTAEEVAKSIAATIYSVWRGQVVQRVIDDTLAGVGLEDFAPGSDRAMSALRHLLDTFPANQGRGASGLQFFAVPGTSGPAEARDVILLACLQDALELLASDAFAPAFGGSTNQNDYRWGKLHRIVFDHPLGDIFNIPPGGGLANLASDLPGVPRSGGFEVVDASGHSARADGVNEFMFGSGPARRFVGEMKTDGPVAEEVIPGGESGLPSSIFRTDQLFLWLTNHYHPWPYRPADVTDATRTVEVLTPR